MGLSISSRSVRPLAPTLSSSVVPVLPVPLTSISVLPVFATLPPGLTLRAMAASSSLLVVAASLVVSRTKHFVIASNHPKRDLAFLLRVCFSKNCEFQLYGVLMRIYSLVGRVTQFNLHIFHVVSYKN